MKRYYLIGIGGIAMANLAGLLKHKGHIVSGSDAVVFEPSLSMLNNLQIPYFNTYEKNNLKKFRPSMVVVGNTVNRGNEELEFVLDGQIPFASMPEVFHSEFIKGKKSIVMAGTSGKTTTTALLAWILTVAGLKPTALVGGVINTIGPRPIYGDGDYAVIEGDEYNSSFFDICPKFLHYQPYIGVVNNVEHDHVDLYPTLEDVMKAFYRFVALIPQSGLLVVNGNNSNAMTVAQKAKTTIKSFGSPSTTFGSKVVLGLHARNIAFQPRGLKFDAYDGTRKLGQIKSPLMGHHNIENILAALAVTQFIKLPFAQVAKAIASFTGVKRRLEIVYNNRGIKIIDDFAHNPHKVAASLSAIRQHHPKSHIVAIFEPRSTSSRRNVFQSVYKTVFSPADLVYVTQPFKKELLPVEQRFSNEQLAKDLKKAKIQAHALDNADQVVEHLKANLLTNFANFSPAKPVIIIAMSSGSFDNIHQKIISCINT